MSVEVWYAIPTANPRQCSQCFEAWQAMGYRTAALINGTDWQRDVNPCDLTVRSVVYPGYARSVINLCNILRSQHDPQIVVIGGDDLWPDERFSAQELADQYVEHFPDLDGLMQPRGDGWGARLCNSPWMGIRWITQAYEGLGPVHSGYYHFYVDTELTDVATMLGKVWWRDDLIQTHKHWTRRKITRPSYLREAKARGAADSRLYQRRRAAGFPGHQFLPPTT